MGLAPPSSTEIKTSSSFLSTQDEFKRVIAVLEDAILATDLAVYVRRREEAFAVLRSGDLDWSNERHRSLLRGMVMTGCDLAAITKPWDIQKKVARLVSAEFFYQGDLERNQLHLEPMDMMNRDKVDRLPALQVDFIDNLCLPVYEVFAEVSEALRPMLHGCLDNRREWKRLAEKAAAAEQRMSREEEEGGNDDGSLLKES